MRPRPARSCSCTSCYYASGSEYSKRFIGITNIDRLFYVVRRVPSRIKPAKKHKTKVYNDFWNQILSRSSSAQSNMNLISRAKFDDGNDGEISGDILKIVSLADKGRRSKVKECSSYCSCGSEYEHRRHGAKRRRHRVIGCRLSPQSGVTTRRRVQEDRKPRGNQFKHTHSDPCTCTLKLISNQKVSNTSSQEKDPIEKLGKESIEIARLYSDVEEGPVRVIKRIRHAVNKINRNHRCTQVKSKEKVKQFKHRKEKLDMTPTAYGNRREIESSVTFDELGMKVIKDSLTKFRENLRRERLEREYGYEREYSEDEWEPFDCLETIKFSRQREKSPVKTSSESAFKSNTLRENERQDYRINTNTDSRDSKFCLRTLSLRRSMKSVEKFKTFKSKSSTLFTSTSSAEQVLDIMERNRKSDAKTRGKKRRSGIHLRYQLALSGTHPAARKATSRLDRAERSAPNLSESLKQTSLNSGLELIAKSTLKAAKKCDRRSQAITGKSKYLSSKHGLRWSYMLRSTPSLRVKGNGKEDQVASNETLLVHATGTSAERNTSELSSLFEFTPRVRPGKCNPFECFSLNKRRGNIRTRIRRYQLSDRRLVRESKSSITPIAAPRIAKRVYSSVFAYQTEVQTHYNRSYMNNQDGANRIQEVPRFPGLAAVKISSSFSFNIEFSKETTLPRPVPARYEPAREVRYGPPKEDRYEQPQYELVTKDTLQLPRSSAKIETKSADKRKKRLKSIFKPFQKPKEQPAVVASASTETRRPPAPVNVATTTAEMRKSRKIMAWPEKCQPHSCEQGLCDPANCLELVKRKKEAENRKKTSSSIQAGGPGVCEPSICIEFGKRRNQQPVKEAAIHVDHKKQKISSNFPACEKGTCDPSVCLELVRKRNQPVKEVGTNLEQKKKKTSTSVQAAAQVLCKPSICQELVRRRNQQVSTEISTNIDQKKNKVSSSVQASDQGLCDPVHCLELAKTLTVQPIVKQPKKEAPKKDKKKKITLKLTACEKGTCDPSICIDLVRKQNQKAAKEAVIVLDQKKKKTSSSIQAPEAELCDPMACLEVAKRNEQIAKEAEIIIERKKKTSSFLSSEQGVCDPNNCPELLRRRNQQLVRETGTHIEHRKKKNSSSFTEDVKKYEKSVPDLSQSSDIPTVIIQPSKQSKIKSFKESITKIRKERKTKAPKERKIKTPKVRKTKQERSPGKQAVRLGSSFSFSIEFSKSRVPAEVKKQNVSTNVYAISKVILDKSQRRKKPVVYLRKRSQMSYLRSKYGFNFKEMRSYFNENQSLYKASNGSAVDLLKEVSSKNYYTFSETCCLKRNKKTKALNVNEECISYKSFSSTFSRSDVTGISPLLRRRFYAMNIRIQERQGRRHRLEPYECEPGVCEPGECNPYECLKLIQKRLLRKASKMSGTTAGSRSMSSGTFQKPQLRGAGLQAGRQGAPQGDPRGGYPPRQRKGKPQPGGHYKTMSKRSRRQAVRVGSSFSFNVEFSKDRMQPRRDRRGVGDRRGSYMRPKEMRTTASGRIVRGDQRSAGTTYGPSRSDQNLQARIRTRDMRSSTDRMLKRCFCTLKLQKAGTDRRNQDQSNYVAMKEMKRTPSVSSAGQSTRGFRAGRRALDSNECEPGFCVPGQCDPYKCLERIRSRHTNTKDFGSGYAPERKSTASITSRQRAGRRGRRTQALRDTSSRSVTSSTTQPQSGKKRGKGRGGKSRGVQGQRGLHHRESQRSTPSRMQSTMTASAVKRCFCTAKLQGVKNVPTVLIQRLPRTEAEKIQTGKIKLEPFECPPGACDPRPGECDPQVCLRKMGRKNKLSGTRAAGGKLLPYECPPGVCVPGPGECDPYACLKKMNRRNKQLGTDGVRSRSSFSSMTPSQQLRAKKVQYNREHSAPGDTAGPQDFQPEDYSGPRDMEVERRYATEDTGSRTGVSMSGDSDRRQAVRIGSTFSFDIEFYKERSPDYKAIEAAARTLKRRSQKAGGKRPRRHQGSDGLSTKTSDQTSQVSGTGTHKGVATMREKDKRCFCTLKLQKKSQFNADKQDKKPTPNEKTSKGVAVKNVPKSKGIHYKLEPYECERGVCTPGKCDPNECLLRIQRRGKIESATLTARGRGRPASSSVSMGSGVSIGTTASGTARGSGRRKHAKQGGQPPKESGTSTKDRRGKPGSSSASVGSAAVSKKNAKLGKGGKGGKEGKMVPKETGTSTKTRRGPASASASVGIGASVTSTASGGARRKRGKQSKRGRQPEKGSGSTLRRRSASSLASVGSGTSVGTLAPGAARRRRAGQGRRPPRTTESARVRSRRARALRNRNRQAVRIGSSCSFNIEFYKDRTYSEGSPRAEAVAMQDESNPRARAMAMEERRQPGVDKGSFQGVESRSFGSQDSRLLRDRDSQSLIPKMRSSMTDGQFLKRCFCTLKLQQSNKKFNPPTHMRNQNVYMATMHNLGPYECEPGVCVPHQCDPVECAKRIRQRMKKKKQRPGIQPSYAYAGDACQQGKSGQGAPWTRAIGTPSKKLTKFTRNEFSEKRPRKQVKLSSSFSFNVDFLKTKSSAGGQPGQIIEPCPGFSKRSTTGNNYYEKGKHMYVQCDEPRAKAEYAQFDDSQCRAMYSQYDEPRGKEASAQYDESKCKAQCSQVCLAEKQSRGVGPYFKSCFCTLKLQKLGKYERENLNEGKIIQTCKVFKPPAQSNKKSGASKSQIKKQIKQENNLVCNENIKKYTQNQNTQTTCAASKSKKNKLSYIKDMAAPTQTKKRGLLPYECEPGMCTPGQCDPYECLERIKRRERNYGTSTGRRVRGEDGTSDGRMWRRGEFGGFGRPAQRSVKVCTLPSRTKTNMCNTVTPPQNNVACQCDEYTSTGVGSFLKRCFCTSTLEEVATDGPVKRYEGKKPRTGIKISTRNKKVETPRVMPPKRNEDYPGWLPYECEPGICTPGRCDPNVCLERIKQRNKTKKIGTDPYCPFQKSVFSGRRPGTCNTRSCQTDAIRTSRIELVQENENTVEERRFKDVFSDQQGVRYGSNINFNIEFYKEQLAPDFSSVQAVPCKQTNENQTTKDQMQYVKPKKCAKQKCSGGRLCATANTRDGIKLEKKTTAILNALKRCLCTLNLQKCATDPSKQKIVTANRLAIEDNRGPFRNPPQNNINKSPFVCKTSLVYKVENVQTNIYNNQMDCREIQVLYPYLPKKFKKNVSKTSIKRKKKCHNFKNTCLYPNICSATSSAKRGARLAAKRSEYSLNVRSSKKISITDKSPSSKLSGLWSFLGLCKEMLSKRIKSSKLSANPSKDGKPIKRSKACKLKSAPAAESMNKVKMARQKLSAADPKPMQSKKCITKVADDALKDKSKINSKRKCKSEKAILKDPKPPRGTFCNNDLVCAYCQIHFEKDDKEVTFSGQPEGCECTSMCKCEKCFGDWRTHLAEQREARRAQQKPSLIDKCNKLFKRKEPFSLKPKALEQHDVCARCCKNIDHLDPAAVCQGIEPIQRKQPRGPLVDGFTDICTCNSPCPCENCHRKAIICEPNDWSSKGKCQRSAVVSGSENYRSSLRENIQRNAAVCETQNDWFNPPRNFPRYAGVPETQNDWPNLREKCQRNAVASETQNDWSNPQKYLFISDDNCQPKITEACLCVNSNKNDMQYPHRRGGDSCSCRMPCTCQKPSTYLKFASGPYADSRKARAHKISNICPVDASQAEAKRKKQMKDKQEGTLPGLIHLANKLKHMCKSNIDKFINNHSDSNTPSTPCYCEKCTANIMKLKPSGKDLNKIKSCKSSKAGPNDILESADLNVCQRKRSKKQTSANPINKHHSDSCTREAPCRCQKPSAYRKFKPNAVKLSKLGYKTISETVDNLKSSRMLKLSMRRRTDKVSRTCQKSDVKISRSVHRKVGTDVCPSRACQINIPGTEPIPDTKTKDQKTGKSKFGFSLISKRQSDADKAPCRCQKSILKLKSKTGARGDFQETRPKTISQTNRVDFCDNKKIPKKLDKDACVCQKSGLENQTGKNKVQAVINRIRNGNSDRIYKTRSTGQGSTLKLTVTPRQSATVTKSSEEAATSCSSFENARRKSNLQTCSSKTKKQDGQTPTHKHRSALSTCKPPGQETYYNGMELSCGDYPFPHKYLLVPEDPWTVQINGQNNINNETFNTRILQNKMLQKCEVKRKKQKVQNKQPRKTKKQSKDVGVHNECLAGELVDNVDNIGHETLKIEVKQRKQKQNHKKAKNDLKMQGLGSPQDFNSAKSPCVCPPAKDKVFVNELGCNDVVPQKYLFFSTDGQSVKFYDHIEAQNLEKKKQKLLKKQQKQEQLDRMRQGREKELELERKAQREKREFEKQKKEMLKRKPPGDLCSCEVPCACNTTCDKGYVSQLPCNDVVPQKYVFLSDGGQNVQFYDNIEAEKHEKKRQKLLKKQRKQQELERMNKERERERLAQKEERREFERLKKDTQKLKPAGDLCSCEFPCLCNATCEKVYVNQLPCDDVVPQKYVFLSDGGQNVQFYDSIEDEKHEKKRQKLLKKQQKQQELERMNEERERKRLAQKEERREFERLKKDTQKRKPAGDLCSCEFPCSCNATCEKVYVNQLPCDDVVPQKYVFLSNDGQNVQFYDTIEAEKLEKKRQKLAKKQQKQQELERMREEQECERQREREAQRERREFEQLKKEMLKRKPPDDLCSCEFPCPCNDTCNKVYVNPLPCDDALPQKYVFLSEDAQYVQFYDAVKAKKLEKKRQKLLKKQQKQRDLEDNAKDRERERQIRKEEAELEKLKKEMQKLKPPADPCSCNAPCSCKETPGVNVNEFSCGDNVMPQTYLMLSDASQVCDSPKGVQYEVDDETARYAALKQKIKKKIQHIKIKKQQHEAKKQRDKERAMKKRKRELHRCACNIPSTGVKAAELSCNDWPGPQKYLLLSDTLRNDEAVKVDQNDLEQFRVLGGTESNAKDKQCTCSEASEISAKEKRSDQSGGIRLHSKGFQNVNTDISHNKICRKAEKKEKRDCTKQKQTDQTRTRIKRSALCTSKMPSPCPAGQQALDISEIICGDSPVPHKYFLVADEQANLPNVCQESHHQQQMVDIMQKSDSCTENQNTEIRKHKRRSALCTCKSNAKPHPREACTKDTNIPKFSAGDWPMDCSQYANRPICQMDKPRSRELASAMCQFDSPVNGKSKKKKEKKKAKKSKKDKVEQTPKYREDLCVCPFPCSCAKCPKTADVTEFSFDDWPSPRRCLFIDSEGNKCTTGVCTTPYKTGAKFQLVPGLGMKKSKAPEKGIFNKLLGNAVMGAEDKEVKLDAGNIRGTMAAVAGEVKETRRTKNVTGSGNVARAETGRGSDKTDAKKPTKGTKKIKKNKLAGIDNEAQTQVDSVGDGLQNTGSSISKMMAAKCKWLDDKYRKIKRKFVAEPCICGVPECEKELMEMKQKKKIILEKPCVCGVPTCEEKIKHFKAMMSQPGKKAMTAHEFAVMSKSQKSKKLPVERGEETQFQYAKSKTKRSKKSKLVDIEFDEEAPIKSKNTKKSKGAPELEPDIESTPIKSKKTKKSKGAPELEPDIESTVRKSKKSKRKSSEPEPEAKSKSKKSKGPGPGSKSKKGQGPPGPGAPSKKPASVFSSFFVINAGPECQCLQKAKDSTKAKEEKAKRREKQKKQKHKKPKKTPKKPTPSLFQRCMKACSKRAARRRRQAARRRAMKKGFKFLKKGKKSCLHYTRIAKSTIASTAAMKSITSTLEQHYVSNFIIHARDPKRRFRPTRKVVKDPVDYECSPFMASLRRHPWLSVYYMCPWFYPHCISCLNVWKQFTDVVLFLLAVGVWSPCILAIEIVRALVCCTFCTG